MADEYLAKTFPDARILGVVHLRARDVQDRKLHFDVRQYTDLDRTCAEVYEREFGRDPGHLDIRV